MPDCIEALRHRPEDIRPERIAAIRVDLYSTALQYGSPTPWIDLAARFSSRHAAALSLCLGPLRHDGFSPERLGRPDVQAVVTCARLISEPASNVLYPENGPARVTLELADGSQTQAEVMTPKGDSSRPLTRPELQAKALGLMRAAWGYDGPFHRIYVLLNDTVPDLAEQLGRVLRRGSPSVGGVTKQSSGLFCPIAGATFWLSVRNGLKSRGVRDILIAVLDGLKPAAAYAALLGPRSACDP